MIHFYGCSYSDGGGMDTKGYYDYIKDEDWVKEYPKETVFDKDVFDIEFKNYFRFSNIIERKLNCKIKNHSCTGNNNQHIFDTLMDELENSNSKDIHIVQWSHFWRQKFWYEENKKFYRLSGFQKNTVAFEENTDNQDCEDINNIFNQWVKYHFNEEYETQKIINYIKLLTSYSNDKNIPIYFMTWDKLPYKNEKFIDFHNKLSLNTLSNQDTIQNYTNGKIIDGHLSHIGNKEVAEKIINKLRQDKLI